MQFDFLKPLFTAAEAPGPVEIAMPPASPHSAPESATVSATSGEVTLPTVKELHAQAAELLKQVGASSLAGRVVIRWNSRLRNTAGMAFPGRALITLNPRLAQFGLEEIDRTFRHELAHLLAHERAGRRRIDPHGKEWRLACVDLGLPGEKRSHDLPLPRHRVRPRLFYRCPGCGFELKRVHPLKRHSACVKCCRAHNRGRYDARFRFVPTPPPPADADH
jgi:predicted SprT family Zn-dependent metalloprotease